MTVASEDELRRARIDARRQFVRDFNSVWAKEMKPDDVAPATNREAVAGERPAQVPGFPSRDGDFVFVNAEPPAEKIGQIIDCAVRLAVAAEREACAKVAEESLDQEYGVAAAIRARGGRADEVARRLSERHLDAGLGCDATEAGHAEAEEGAAAGGPRQE